MSKGDIVQLDCLDLVHHVCLFVSFFLSFGSVTSFWALNLPTSRLLLLLLLSHLSHVWLCAIP